MKMRGGSDGEKMKMKIMRNGERSTLQRRRKPLVMCEKRKYRSGALGVHSRRERSHGYTYAGKQWEKKGKENAKWR